MHEFTLIYETTPLFRLKIEIAPIRLLYKKIFFNYFQMIN